MSDKKFQHLNYQFKLKLGYNLCIMNYTDIAIGVSAAILSGVGSTIISNIRENKKETEKKKKSTRKHGECR